MVFLLVSHTFQIRFRGSFLIVADNFSWSPLFRHFCVRKTRHILHIVFLINLWSVENHSVLVGLLYHTVAFPPEQALLGLIGIICSEVVLALESSF